MYFLRLRFITFVILSLISFSFLYVFFPQILSLSSLPSKGKDRSIVNTKGKKFFKRVEERLRSSEENLTRLIIEETTSIESLKKVLFPFSPDQLAIFSARRAKYQNSRGHNYDSLFPKSWQKHFFLGTHKGSPLFEKKSGFFFKRPLTFSSFQRMTRRLNFLVREDQTYCWYFYRFKGYQVLILFRLKNSKLLPPQTIKTVQEKGKSTELTLALILIFCFLLTFIIPRSLQFRLKSSFLSQYFLFLYLGFLLSIMGAQHVNQMVFELEGNLAKQKMLGKAESFRLDLEENLNFWIEKLEEKLNHSVSNKLSPAALPLPAKSQSALISKEGVDQFYPDPPAAFFEKLMYAAGPVLLTEQKDSKLNLEEVTKNWELSMPRNMDSLDYISGADAEELANTLNVHRYNKVTLFQFSVMNHFLYFLRWPNEQKYQLFFSAIPFESAVEIYMSEQLGEWSQEYPHWSFRVRRTQSDQRFSSPHSVELWDETDEQCDTSVDRNLIQNCSDYHHVSVEGQAFGGFVLEAMQSDKILFESRDSNLQSRRVWIPVTFLLLLISSILTVRALLIRFEFANNILGDLLKEEIIEKEMSCFHDEFHRLELAMLKLSESLEEERRLSPFIAKQVLNLFLDEQGNRRYRVQDEAVVLFSDLRSFTTISENEDPEDVVKMLNDYFSLWENVVEQFGGVIERFIGDAIVVVFFKQHSLHYVQNALECALHIRKALKTLNHERESDGLFTIQNGYGLAKSRVEFQVIGNQWKKHFITTGESVELSEELEALSKHGKSTKVFVDDKIKTEMYGIYEFESQTLEGIRCHEVSLVEQN